jgi:hypothetical protein
MPKRHGKQSGHAENQREGKEVPLFPEKIDVGILKKFHSNPLKPLLQYGVIFSVASS